MNQVGRYQILEELGRGATGVVYRALDPAIGRTIAIKSIRFRDFADTVEKRIMRERLLREAKSAGLLSHPNVVTIYDVLESEDVAYIFMEYVDGTSLENLLRHGALPEREPMLQFLRQIAEALDYAHRKGVVHRDIKPANIIISEGRPGTDRLAKIADFGVAKSIASDVTHSGTVIGTPNYMSPEQIQRIPVGGAADQFALGVIVYELLCGEKPFTADNLTALCYAICKQAAVSVYEVNAALNETVQKVVERAMAKSPEDRYASCGEFIGALTIAVGDCPQWVPLAARSRLQIGEDDSENGFHIVKAPRTEAHVTPSPALALAGTEATIEKETVSGSDPEVVEPEPSARETRHRRDTPAPSAGTSLPKKIALTAALLLALCGLVVLIVRLNSGPNLPVQVADPRLSPGASPPEDLSTSGKQTASPPADLTTPPPVAVPGQVSSPKVGATTADSNAQSNAAPRTSPENDMASAAAKQPRQTAQQQRPNLETAQPLTGVSDVELVSDPPGAKVTVDRRPDLSCIAPCSLMLPGGRHTLEADETGYGVARKIFRLPGEDNVFISLAKNVGVLLVTTQPSGSQVAVDGRDYGTTPVKIVLSAGRHHLSLSDGSRRHDETIEIDADGVHARSFRW